MIKHLSQNGIRFVQPWTLLLTGIFILLFTVDMMAQTPSYIKQNATTTNTIPLNSGTTARTQWLYLPGDFAPATIPGNITRIWMRSTSINQIGTYSGFTLKMTQQPITGFANNTFLTGMSTVITSASFPISGHTTVVGGWFPIDLQTPFAYDNSQALIIEFMYTSRSGGITCSTTTASPATRRITTTTPANTTGTLSGIINDLGLEITPSAGCTSPPTPGTVLASHAPVLCLSNAVSLNLTGNSIGTGQTYQWESSPTLGGTYTPVSGVLTSSPFATTAPSASTYYRCAVTCSSATAYSDEYLLNVTQPLAAGTYTIDKNQPTGGTNYNSFADAISAMHCGIAGPIVFSVVPSSGDYTEQVVIPEIIGSSSTNTITFNGNGNILKATPNSTNRHILRINGADNIIIDSLKIVGLDATYGWGIHMATNSHNITIRKCTIDLSATFGTTTSSAACGILAANSTSTATTEGENTGIVITDNTVIGGYMGVRINQIDATLATGNRIANNIIRDYYGAGVEFVNQDSMIVEGNDFSRALRVTSTTFSGVEIGAGNKDCIIRNNKVHDTNNSTSSQTGTAYGIAVLSCDAPSTEPNLIYNNLIYNFNSAGGTQYGLYNSGSDGTWFYHNTVNFDNTASTAGITRGFYQTTTASNIKFFNNLVSITREGNGAKNCIYLGTLASSVQANNNSYYISSSLGVNGVGFHNAVNYVSMNDWQGANSNAFDQNGVYGDPDFVNASSGDLTPQASVVNNAGTNLGITTDIYGNARNLTNPDPGAIEFELLGTDAALSWVLPLNPIAAGLTSITLKVDNVQAQTITSVSLSYFDGVTIETQSFTGLNILPGASQNLTFSVQYDLQVSTVMKAYINSVNGVADASQLNDTTQYTMCVPLLAGTYTINSAIGTGAGNYQSFTEAAFALSCGVTGPVVFNVVPGSGPYNEQITIPEISGASATNTITINGNHEVISYNIVNTAERGIIKLSGADYVTIDSLTFETPGTYGIGVLLNNDADHNIVSNSIFRIDSTATSTNFSAISISFTSASSTATGASGCDSNTFVGNYIRGGYYGITVVGLAATPIHGNKVINNTIIDAYLYHVYVNGTNNTLVEGNNIYRSTRANTSTFYGVYFTAQSTNAKVFKNRIHDPFDGEPASTDNAFGVYITACDANVNNPNLVANNLVYNFQGNGQLVGLYNSGSSHAHFYHNTVVIDDPSATVTTASDDTKGFYQTTIADSVRVFNNLFYVNRGGSTITTCIDFNENTSTVFTDHNALYYGTAGTGPKYVGQTETTDHVSLNSWQTVLSGAYDQSSVFANPLFNSAPTGDYTPTEILLDAIGDSLGIYTDINNVTRDSANPDPGAIEFVASGAIDIGAFNLVAPVQDECVTNAETVVIQVKNYGGTIDFTTNPSTLTLNVSGATTATLTAPLTGSMLPNTFKDVTLTGTIDMSANGVYYFDAYVTTTGDIDNANDTMTTDTITRTAINTGVVSTVDTVFCISGAPTLSIAGNTGGSIQWQSSSSATGPWTNVGTGGVSYSPGTITVTEYYRVELTCLTEVVHTNVQEVKVNNPQLLSTTDASFCGTGSVLLQSTTSPDASTNWYTSATGGAPVFTGNNFQTPVLNSTTTYYATASSGGSVEDMPSPPATGSTFITSSTGWGLHFQVNSAATIGTVTMYPLNSTPGPASIQIKISDLSDVVLYTSPVHNFISSSSMTQEIIPVNIALPPGTYKMGMTFTGLSGMMRNSSGITYPYSSSGNEVVITAGANGSGSASATTAYYWFYDWVISTGCESSPRVPVTATQTGTSPSITATVSNATICNGGVTQLIATSTNDAYSYVWTPGNLNGDTVIVNPTVSTTYTVTATDTSGGALNGCIAVAQASVVVLPASISLSALPSTLCYPGGTTTISISPSTGFPAGTIEWYTSPDGISYTLIPSASSASYTTPNVTSSTYYKARIIDGVGAPCVEATYFLELINPTVLTTSTGSRCGYGSVQLGATADPGATILWYGASTGGAILGTGGTFNTPAINTNTTFYVAAASGFTSYATGKPTFTPGPSNGSGTTNFGIIFDVLSDMTIDSVTVYPVSSTGSSGTVTVDVLNGSGAVVFTKTVSVVGYPSGTYVPTVIPLGFNLVPGTNYKMRPAFTGISQLVFDPSATAVGGNHGYPYVIPGVLNIKYSTLTAAPTNTARLDLYYYFYNWKVSVGCIGQRTPVVAAVTPAPSLAFAVSDSVLCKGESTNLSLSSANDPNYSYVWNTGFNGANQTVSPPTNMLYFVTATDTTNGPFAGCVDTISRRVYVNPVPDTPMVSQNPLIVCDGVPVTLTTNAPAPFMWSTGETTASIVVTPPIGSSSYTVTATNSFGCTTAKTTSLNASFTPHPIVTPVNDTTICFGNIIKLAVADTGQYTGGYPAGTIVDWIGIVSGLTPQDSITSDNGSVYQARVTLASGCQTLSSVRTVITRAVATSSQVSSAACGASNGKIVTTVSNGALPIRYLWKSGATVIRDVTTSAMADSIENLAPGNYTLEVTDSFPSGCSSGILNYTVNSSDPVVASINATPIACNGGEATAGASYTGGTGAVTYLWNTGATTSTIFNLLSGTYTVTITDALGCFDEETIVITEPLPITAVITSTPPSCGGSDGSVAAYISGGTQPYSVAWFDVNTFSQVSADTFANGLPAGDYALIVDDLNACNLTEFYSLLVNPAPVAVDSFAPVSGPVGTVVTIYGQNLGGVTAVSFNGTAALSFTAINSTTVNATVPAGATSGTIEVTTPCGIVTTTTSFTVTVPSFAALNLKVLIEGYYVGGGLMTPVLLNQGVSASDAVSDSVTVELRDALSPTTIVESQKVELDTAGKAVINFPSGVIGQNLYVVILHRSALQTWSALPVTFASSNSFDFTSSGTQAFGDNQKLVEPGVWAIYSGDLNQDEFIDVFDYPIFDTDNSSFAAGYYATDMNGDGFVDVFDYPIFDVNNAAFIMSVHP